MYALPQDSDNCPPTVFGHINIVCTFFLKDVRISRRLFFLAIVRSGDSYLPGQPGVLGVSGIRVLSMPTFFLHKLGFKGERVTSLVLCKTWIRSGKPGACVTWLSPLSCFVPPFQRWRFYLPFLFLLSCSYI